MKHSRGRGKRLASELGPILLLVGATVGFFWRTLLTADGWKPAGGGDLVSFLFPTYRFAASTLWSGKIPLWNPYLYGGVPFLADMQSGLFYPPNLLLWLLAPAFPYRALQWMAVLHVFLAGLFMFLCLRYFEPGRPLRTPAAMAGAVAFMFSDMFLVHFGNLNLIAVAAWLPLIWLLFWRALRTRNLGMAVGAGLAFGLSTLAGHLQMTLFTGLALIVAAGVEAVARSGPGNRETGTPEVRGPRWAWPVIALLVTAVVAMGLSALVLLPAFEYAQHSPRSSLSYQDAARYSLVPALLGEMLVPALFSGRDPALYWGVWDRVAAGYVGVFTLLLAVLGVLLRKGRRITLYVALAAVSLLLALGGTTVVHGWVYRFVPGFGQLRAPARFVLVLDFALAALAALGLDRLLGALDRRARATLERVWRGLLPMVALAAIVGCAWAYLVIYQAQDRDPTLFWRVSWAGSGVIWALLILGAGLAWLGARRAGRLRRTALAWLPVGLIFVDLAAIGAYGDLGSEPPTEGFEHSQAISFLKGDPGFFRIDSRTDVWDVWQPDLALLEGLYDVGGVDNPLVIADAARFWEGTGGRSTQLYDLLGVRYVIGSKAIVLDWRKFSLAYDGDPTVNVYRNETALPRAFVAHRAITAASHEEAWTQLHEPGLDLSSTVVLEGGAALDAQPEAGEQASVRVTAYSPDRLAFEVETPAAGYLVLSDPFYPGWRARVDGEPAKIIRADYAFRAVAVPAGSHRVTMAFRPITWTVGLALTGATVLALVVMGGIGLARSRRRA